MCLLGLEKVKLQNSQTKIRNMLYFIDKWNNLYWRWHETINLYLLALKLKYRKSFKCDFSVDLILNMIQFSCQHLSAGETCLLYPQSTVTYTMLCLSNLWSLICSSRLPHHARYIRDLSSPHKFIRPPTLSSSVPSSSIIIPISMDFQDLTSFSQLQPTVYTANGWHCQFFQVLGNWDHKWPRNLLYCHIYSYGTSAQTFMTKMIT